MKRYPFAAGAASLFILLVAASAPAASAPAAWAPAASAPASSAPATTPPATSAPAAAIVISAFQYSGDLTVKTGQEVTVTNADPAVPVPVLHTLTDQQIAPLFDTGPIQPGRGTATFTAPAQPGSYPFGCLFHLTMQGTLVVQG